MPDVVLRPTPLAPTDVWMGLDTGWIWDVTLLGKVDNDPRMLARRYTPGQAATGTPIIGNLDVTLGAVLLNGGGILLVTGALSRTLGDATLVSSGTIAVTGALDTWLGTMMLSATGTVTGGEPEPTPTPERYIGRQRARQRTAWFIMPLLDKQAHNEHDDEDTLLLL